MHHATITDVIQFLNCRLTYRLLSKTNKDERKSKETQLRRARDFATLARLTDEKQSLESTLTEARAAEEARQHCQTKCDAIRVTNTSLAELRGADRERALAEDRLGSAATRIDHSVDTSAVVRLAGEPLKGDGSVTVTEVSELEVEGAGVFTIHPGGEDLDRLRAQVEDRTSALQELLIELRLAGIADAERALHTREKLDSQAKQYKARLGALAPNGVMELESKVLFLNRQRQDLLEKVGDGPPPPGSTNDVEVEVNDLTQAIEELESELRTREDALHEWREHLVEARTAAAAAGSHAEGLSQALDAARQDSADETLAGALAEANRAVERKQEDLSAAERALQAEQPDAVALEVERAQNALSQIKSDIEKLTRDIRDATVELNTLGQRGLAEEVAQTEVEYAFVERELAYVEAQAKAIDLLYLVLNDALRSAKETVVQPVIAKVVPYMRQLIPGAQPSINEDMLLTGIRRGADSEPFGELSIGTREQLAVLLRLAYADLLSENGVPVTVILDDALVNSDDGRRERMKAILYQAAKKYQVLVLTCHVREYGDTGGKLISLAECNS